MKELAVLNKYFLRYKWRLLMGVIFVASSNVFGILPPRVIRNAFDTVAGKIEEIKSLEQNSSDLIALASSDLNSTLLWFALLVIGFYLIKGLFMFLMRQTIVVMSRMIEYDLKNDLYDHYQRLSLAFYKRNQTGDLMSRLTEDVNRVRMYLGPAILYSVNLTVLLIFVISSMLSVSPKLTLYVLLPLPVLSISIYYVNRIINRRSERIQEQLSDLTSFAQESYSGIRVVKAFARENQMLQFFDKESANYKSESLGLARVQAMFFPLMILLVGASTIFTIYIGGLEAGKGNITAGNIAEFVIYVNMLTFPVMSIGWVASIIQRAAASQKRINAFLKTKPEIESNGQKTVNFTKQLEFKNVNFTYEDTDIQAVKSVSFSIHKGQKIALVGRTGSGKSSIASLLNRTYDVSSGKIMLDGIPIQEFDLDGLRAAMSYVPQDVFLFSDTIAGNIAFGMEDYDMEAITKAAKLACIHDEISSLPASYDTIVGERGITLSGGQKQRISIARALLREAEVYIFDDCLSAVDASTEKQIIENLNLAWENKTVVFITHRIFSVMDFDKIIVLDNGTVVDKGEHEEMVKNNGLYKMMYDQQKLEREEKISETN